MSDSAALEAPPKPISESRIGGFAAGLLDPDAAVPDGLSGTGISVPTRRYAVYRNNVVSSLMEAMETAYPSLLAIMGKDRFGLVARNFISARPPKTAMMQFFGEGFADFLAGFPPLRKSPFLGDVARAERACVEAFHAADAPLLDGSKISAVGDARSVTFSPHPAFVLIKSNWPVFDLFAFRHQMPDGGVDLGHGQCMLITRPALEVETRLIDPTLHDFLAALAGGMTLGEAAAAALGQHESFDLAGGLALALVAGCFSGSQEKSA